MKPEIKKLWTDALRSGEYQQGRGSLVDRRGDTNCFCVLGVLCEVALKAGIPLSRTDTGYSYIYVQPATGETFSSIVSGGLPQTVADWAGVNTWPLACQETGTAALINLNDDGGLNFHQLADIIERDEIK